jgi:hypothetical protein
MRHNLLWLVPFLAGFFGAGPGVPAAAGQNLVTVTLYDWAGLRLEVRAAMKRETTRIFLQAGVVLDWVECEVAGKPMNLEECAQPLGPARLMLQLVPGSNKSKPNATGMAIIQGEASVFACLYPDRVIQLAREANWEFGDLLGHAAAHELGHLLLRSSSHTQAGVMRAPWETEDLRKLSHTGLIFLPGQLSAIRAAISPQPPRRSK